MSDLTPRQRLFVAEYLKDLNATQAAIRAGYSSTSARQLGAENMANPAIRSAVDQALAERAKRLSLEADDVVRELAAVVAADPRELIEYVRQSCRYCHGEGHRYQRTPAERERALSEWQRLKDLHERDAETAGQPFAEFDEQGGVGFDPRREPHPDCPECFGRGEQQAVIADTRYLSPAAARLYAGVKVTRDGVELKTVSREKFVELAGRHLGMWNDKLDVNDARSPDEIRRLLEEVRRERELLEAREAVSDLL